LARCFSIRRCRCFMIGQLHLRLLLLMVSCMLIIIPEFAAEPITCMAVTACANDPQCFNKLGSFPFFSMPTAELLAIGQKRRTGCKTDVLGERRRKEGCYIISCTSASSKL